MGDEVPPRAVPWSPETQPDLPDRVTRLEVVQEQLKEDAEKIMQTVRWANRAGWLIAFELAAGFVWLLVSGAP